jgi:hypothetical protein
MEARALVNELTDYGEILTHFDRDAASVATSRLRRVEMWRGDFRREHICFRPFRLAVP